MRIAVIGAGYAGLAAAVELASLQVPVDVFEASRSLGGRARAVRLGEVTVDNGAHILVGAYRETQRLMRTVGVPDGALRRQRLRLDYPGHMRLAAPALPAPLHLAWALLTARGLGMTDKLAAIRFMSRLRANRFRLAADMPVSRLLEGQPARLRRFLWEPLCLASLNTPPQQASAQVFLNVLRDSLAADPAASDLLLPATDFSSLFPEPAAHYIAARGGQLRRGCRIGSITTEAGWFLLDGRLTYDRLIVAVAPQHLSSLVAELPAMTAAAEQVARFDYEPITTCYLAYPASLRLPFPMVGVEGGHAQWLFDRGALCGQAGLLAAVISARGAHDHLPPDALAGNLHEEVKRLLPAAPPPSWHRVIREQRATFACRPDLARPPTRTPLPGLVLAGDYVAGDYPATIEGAVRSGVAAARLLVQEPSPA
jgi:squalene-associated FAD-dependent desaturase